MDLLCSEDWIDIFGTCFSVFRSFSFNVGKMTNCGCALNLSFFILQDPGPLCLSSGLCSTQRGDPSCAALCCYSNSCSCCCNVPVPRLHQRRLCPVLCCCRRRRRCLRAVSVRGLASADELHDHCRVRIRRPAAARCRGHSRSCGCSCRLQPISASAAAD